MATIREAFEEWYSEGGAHPNAIKCRTAGGEYLLAQAATSWNVWQAAHSSRDKEVRRFQEQVELLREALASLCDSQLTSRDREDAINRGLAALEATKEGA